MSGATGILAGSAAGHEISFFSHVLKYYSKAKNDRA